MSISSDARRTAASAVSDEGHDRAVGRFARIDVEQFDALGFFDHFGDLPYDLLIASLAEIGYAFDDSFLHDKSYF